MQLIQQQSGQVDSARWAADADRRARDLRAFDLALNIGLIVAITGIVLLVTFPIKV